MTFTINLKLPVINWSTTATAPSATTTEFDCFDHHVGTKDTNHIRLETNANRPNNNPKLVANLSELKIKFLWKPNKDICNH